jgi:hypothetical protein
MVKSKYTLFRSVAILPEKILQVRNAPARVPRNPSIVTTLR